MFYSGKVCSGRASMRRREPASEKPSHIPTANQPFSRVQSHQYSVKTPLIKAGITGVTDVHIRLSIGD